MFEKLKAEVQRENDSKRNKILEDISNYNNTDELKENLYFYWISETIKNNIKTDKYTFEKAQAILINRTNKYFNKLLSKDLDKIQTVLNAKLPERISVSVEWTKSRTWGNNPTAEVRANMLTVGHATGCGYDKESAAVSVAFNSNSGILKVVYLLKELYLQTNKKLPYGLGYGVLPYFEGGVGMSCFKDILIACGYVVEANHGNKYDSYIFFKEDTQW